ncbi:MAG: hypothetical protein Q9217_004387 [Psora testacea]
METLQAGTHHLQFIQWAKDRGVKINGVHPAQVRGRGLGIVADRRIEAGEKLISVPREALLTVQSIPEVFKHSYRGIRGSTVHGLLASFLAFGGAKKSHYDSWTATWPSPEEIADSMPLLWPRILREPFTNRSTDTCPSTGQTVFPLPPAIGGKWASSEISASCTLSDASLLHRQEIKLQKDWKIVSRVFPDSPFCDFVYYWLMVNTRCFYYEMPGEGNVPSVDDCLLTQSHGDLITDGFSLEKNRWDSLPLDDFFNQALIDEKDSKRLAGAGYLGHYTLSDEGVCHRTQVAVRTQTLDSRKWEEYVAGYIVGDEHDDAEADAFVATRIMRVYYEEAKAASLELDKAGDILPFKQRETLLMRWKQIKLLIQKAFTNGINKNVQAAMHELFDLPLPLTGN